MKKKTLKQTLEIVKKNEKLVDNYWNKKRKWSLDEITDLIREEINKQKMINEFNQKY